MSAVPYASLYTVHASLTLLMRSRKATHPNAEPAYIRLQRPASKTNQSGPVSQPPTIVPTIPIPGLPVRATPPRITAYAHSLTGVVPDGERPLNLFADGSPLSYPRHCTRRPRRCGVGPSERRRVRSPPRQHTNHACYKEFRATRGTPPRHNAPTTTLRSRKRWAGRTQTRLSQNRGCS